MSVPGGYRQVVDDDADLESLGDDDAYTQPHTFRERISYCWRHMAAWAGGKRAAITHCGGITIAILTVTLIWRFAISAPDSPVPAPGVPDKWDVRLPDWIVPEHYDLDLSEVNFEKLEFGGSVDITLDVRSATSFVVVHSKDLDVDGKTARFVGPDVDLVPAADNRPERQYTVYWLERPVSAGKYKLHLEFRGKLTDSLRGFYYSVYRGENGKKKFIGTTQFEATDARRAFPCLDEPSKKATFQINVTVPDGYHALSNMPHLSVVKTTTGQRRFVFDTTKRMSTYLIAFIVSDFESITSHTSRGVAVSVWTPPSKTHLGEYGLKVATTILDYYEGRYGINYPLPKMDLIAIPDFAAGAMENWGLVTYRDTALLYDEKSSSEGNKQRVAEVIAHELAHQWFGNLVTMNWWNDLWLNEGFAEFMEYKGTNAAESTWRMDDQFVPADLLRAMEADASQFTHPIAVQVHDPNEIQEIFDDISYGKGSSILRMLQTWLDDALGNDTFFKRIHAYLEAHAYQNAKTLELWQALSDSQVDVGALMSTWTDQPGFPVVRVLDETTPGQLVVEQERMYFAELSKDSDDHAEKQKWQIPLTYSVYISGKKPEISRATHIVKELGKVQIPTKSTSPNGVPLLNVGRTGVYRVQYPAWVYKRFVELLSKDLSVLEPVDRAGLIDDAFSMLLSGRESDATIALNLTRLLTTETDPIVWQTLLRDLKTLESYLVFHPGYGKLLSYELKLLHQIIQKVDWEDDESKSNQGHLMALLRSEVLGKAVFLGDLDTVEEALWYFGKLKNGTSVELTPDVLGVVYDAGVIWGSEADYEWVYKSYLSATSAQEEQRLLHALASVRQPYLQLRTLTLALSEHVRKQDLHRLIAQVSEQSPTGYLITWNFIRDNWNALLAVESSSGDYTRLNNLVGTIVGRFAQKSLVEDAERLFVKREGDMFVPPRIEIPVRKGLEKARQRVRWMEVYGDKVGAWLAGEME
ncbi:hypothetical protein SpCBS45565_g07130 [Spizellomyces sp. 'palustris']|nr:hypothetical protein SpCBS45565_g07130 [Spizellomyces sp. 'palustris']